MGGYTIILVALVIAALSTVGWFATPKGVNQTLLRTSILLTLTACYLMWAITYLAQLHPILSPRRADLRFED